jgi:hypothetical protein
MSDLTSLTSAQFKQAADIKDQIEALNQKLADLLGASLAPVKAVPAAAAAPVGRPAKKSKFSPEGIAKIKAAQKARWAKVRAQKAGKSTLAAAVEKPAKKRKMSPEGIAKIKAAQKARWAKVRAAKKA